eukprot:scaffold8044_cov42-Prasinocladus_malaysianus.AAC.2
MHRDGIPLLVQQSISQQSWAYIYIVEQKGQISVTYPHTYGRNEVLLQQMLTKKGTHKGITTPAKQFVCYSKLNVNGPGGSHRQYGIGLKWKSHRELYNFCWRQSNPFPDESNCQLTDKQRNVTLDLL